MEDLYLRGFNEGYLIASERPKLAEELSSISSQQPRILGIKDGYRQFVLEKVRDKQPLWMNRQDYGLPPPDHGIDKDVGMER